MSSRTWVIGVPDHDGVQRLGQRLRAQAEKPGLILVDPDPDLARGLHPVEVDQPQIGVFAHRLAELERDRAHLGDVRPADPILHRPADRRPELERRNADDRARQLLGQRLLELQVQPVARRHVLGDHDGLREKVVGELDVERQVETDRAASDIGAPARDVRIVLEHGVELGRRCLAGVDRGVLRQGQIDDELRAVGSRERTAAAHRAGRAARRRNRRASPRS